jgi:hypothetical protein
VWVSVENLRLTGGIWVFLWSNATEESRENTSFLEDMVGKERKHLRGGKRWPPRMIGWLWWRSWPRKTIFPLFFFFFSSLLSGRERGTVRERGRGRGKTDNGA